ncbi:MAG: DNA polymerase III subunit alpha [Parcubacteria group bacterium Gr01-1014_66]|nr:MAG: DNA polymerase III subunit alpha [Parcubacteria group bacterium Gr01-1014_66]
MRTYLSHSSFSKGGGRRPEDFERINPSPYSGEPNGLIALWVLPLEKGEFRKNVKSSSNMKFTHLHVHSHYSLLDGLAKIDQLVKRAADFEMDSLALTDHGNLYGAIEFYQKAKKAGIKPIIGCEMYIAANRMADKNPGVDDKRYHLTVLAATNEGYRNLITLVSKAHLEGFYYKPRVDKELLAKHSAGLIALSGCFNGEIGRALQYKKPDLAQRLIHEYQDIFGKENFYLEVQPHISFENQRAINEGLFALAPRVSAKIVATNDIHYAKSEDADAQDILVSVQTGSRIQNEDRLSMKGSDLSLRSAEEMAGLFPHNPEVITNTQEIAERAHIDIELGKNQLPRFSVPSGYDANTYLTELCHKGLEQRYGLHAQTNPAIEERLNYELRVISQTGFASYFLIVQDFIAWARNQGIVVGPGRGSAAGSLVSYVLRITDIDPLRYNLIFERFLNPERISMPDIDLDFADTRRDEVINYVADKYGHDHVAQIITFGTMAARAAIRDTGRALGMPYSFCDQIAKMIPFTPQGEKVGWLKKSLTTVKEFQDLYNRDEQAKKLIDAAMKLEGVVRHASTHACGVVISPRPLEEYVPLQYAVRHTDLKTEEKKQVVVTQYEMHAIEDLGLLKMDFLGLRNLSIIERALKNIKRQTNEDIAIESIPLDDKKTFELFQKGLSTGVFQFESPGMKRYLKELKPTELEDLIAMVALYRPGPIELIPSYIKRKHKKERIEYLHPKLEPILKNTYGIGVYQEQMMQIARDLAGYTLPQADTLRKAIGKKIKSLLDEQQAKLTSGMIANSIDAKTATAIWELFPPFARYGFNRSHAACYALIAYQTGYLKAHYPTEFMTALLAAESTDVEKIAFFIEETRAMDIDVLAPDVNESFADFTVVAPKKIRFGLGAVKNVGANIVQAIIDERTQGGKFTSIGDMAERVAHKDFNKKSAESLIKCGACDAFGERGQMLGNIELILEYNRECQKQKYAGQISLFGMANAASAHVLRLQPKDAALDGEKLRWEKELLGLYITQHPITIYQETFARNNITPIKSITPSMRNQTVSIGGVITTIQKINTKSGDAMLFVKLEDTTAKTEVLVFPKVLAQFPDIWKEENVIFVKGRVSDKDGTPKILCEKAAALKEPKKLEDISIPQIV